MKQEIQKLIKKYKEKKSQRFLQLKRPNTDLMFKAHYKAQIFLISEIMADLKKLNEAIVSEGEFCHCKSSNVTNRICNRCKKVVNYKLPGQN